MKKVTIPGNHLPRQCGIATFTTHLAGGTSIALATGIQLLDWLDRHGTAT